eukprot:1785311-Pyramimonas_sp.AAC.1
MLFIAKLKFCDIWPLLLITITVLQEVHGPAAAVEELLSRVRGEAAVFGSSGCGDVCALVPKHMLSLVQVSPMELVAGRLLLLQVRPLALRLLLVPLEHPQS